ncbi:hypothetical protein AMJ39_03250 [candidate division TA06 bacterium DG_24]|jgi:diadenylate cyclase|uniref:Diadenylate cyclase n=3 Tax=Bacteria division TA06 TaxID=1156500 RepID=A0A0S8JI96_UNCT6|nr:MAG: hypothetical protein AMJ39_03250 [candidate division TA06 bacterium DG_24]KPK70771.1 MAG: hypothetical protein AMJ82_02465 [candidate division TA06 bacterium SM23_40]KPL09513.1 MAG: hypothetical protein AMJ71_06285 [candidate division TA06 bacterium SM1_40]
MISSVIHIALAILDIVIVAFIAYQLLLLIRGSRATEMLVGLLVIVVVSLVAYWWDLGGTKWIISTLKAVWVVAFVILFQPELRRALAQLGRNRLVRAFLRIEQSEVVDEIIGGVEGLVDKKIGGLIAIERRTGLKEYIETGVLVEARVSADLITTIFMPHSPLHDGAVVIHGDSIVAAGCILPLSEDTSLERELGTRHRAALGLSEETDAVCVVISEETQKVSFASRGKLVWAVDSPSLRKNLLKALGRDGGV